MKLRIDLEKEYGIVLEGGGARGAYQIGVWKAMRELHIDYQLVAGTSVGALNGALMVQQEYDKALRVWENISSQEIVGDAIPQQDDPDDRFLRRAFAHQAFAHGGVELSALEHFVSRLVDEERFWDSPVDFALVTVEYPSLKPLELMKKDIPKGKLQEYLMASAACFPAFQTKEIDGRRYMDGGYHDNMPVNLALKMGADRVIAVDLDDEKLVLAKRVGASYAVNSKTENVHERIQEITAGFGADVVIEAVGSPVTYVMAVDEVGFTGRVVCIGYAKKEVAFQTKYFVQKELDIRGSRNALPADFRAVINYMKEGKCPVEELISKIAKPEDALEAMKEWAADPGKVFRTLVEM